MKQLSFIVYLLFVFFPLLFLTGCEKDEMKVSANDSTLTDFDYQSVDDARQWFYQQTGGNVFLERELSTKSTGVQTAEVPLFGDWENSISQRVGHINNVETPVFTVGDEEAFSEALKGTSLLKSESTEETVRSRTRIVVQTNEESGETRGFLMTVVPDEDYLASGGSIDSVDYYHRGETFSGLIVFNHLDGSFANAWKYKGGEIINGFIPMVPGKSELEKALKAFAQIEYVFCTSTYVSFAGYTSYAGSDCWIVSETIWYYEDYYQDSRTRYEFENSFDPPIEPSSGGSNNNGDTDSNVLDRGEYLPYDPVSQTPLIDKLVKDNLLDSVQSKLLEQAFGELTGVCSDEYIYNELVANNQKFNFEMDSSLPHPAGYDPASKTFKFRDNDAITSGKLKEEFFHAYQDFFYDGGIAQYADLGRVNIEFEAKLYKDISNVKCCDGFNNEDCPQKIKDDYFDWISQLRENPASLTNSDYQKWLKFFDTYTPSYSSPFASNLSSPDALKSILSNSGCSY
jgi:hypothetical protein